jgi:hypothetical protein
LRSTDKISHWIDLLLCPERFSEVGIIEARTRSASRVFVWLAGSHLGTSNAPAPQVLVIPAQDGESTAILSWIWIPRRFPHPAQYGPFRNVEAQHLWFSMNPRRAPGGILGHQAEDELAQFNADALPAGATSMQREPGSIKPEACAVPLHKRFRLNDNQCLLPGRPEATQYHPEKSVGNTQARTRLSPFQDSKLLPEGEIFQEKITTRTKEYDNRNGQELHQTQHQSSIPWKHGPLDTSSFA